ncbi:hypothetical protein [Erythrobacter donghaensis]|uniref:hypothetical protein n=1 Tax=Erythrobacter donghaensis TaxID=267135 RepID=UPI000A3BE943|nr:hypothetical protein [Erythrobacter donghaensis]
MRALVASLALAAALAGAPALAADEGEDDDTEIALDLLHAPLPLYTFAWPDLWPRSFTDDGPDKSFGCASRVAFGDWQFVSDQSDYSGLEGWTRIENYGVFHCAANLYEADEREELEQGEFSRGLFARIGEGRSAQGKTYELWVLQQGFIPGSSYVLLARDPSVQEEGTIARFDVLQRECPPGRMRKAKDMDVWSTGYCLIESRDELLALARMMLRKPFAGTFVRAVEPVPGSEPSED